MNKFGKILGVIALLAATVAVAGEYMEYTRGTWRYKITIAVETPEGVKTGSAVREVTVTRGDLLLPESTPSKDSKGEAVVVDLGKRGVLFALTSFDDYQTVFAAFPFSGGGTTKEGIQHYSHLTNVKAILKPAQYPRLVAFRDMNDPKTVEAVRSENLAEHFGEGVTLKDITLEMTDEPVTWQVAHWLPWLGDYYNKRLDGDRYGSAESEFPIANSLSSGAFSTGEFK